MTSETTRKKTTEKIVVVGINHAGTSAIRTLLAQDPELEINAYDRNSNISFLGCGIALAVGGTVKNPEDLFYCDQVQLDALGAKVFMEHDVLAIDTQKKTIRVRDLKTGREFQDSYDKLVYAAGSWPLDIPGVPPEKARLKNIMLCKLYQHAQELIKKADEPEISSVAVIGAGYIGIELAEAYRQKGKNVTLIDYETRVIPRYFDTEFTRLLEDDMRRAGITLALGEKVIDFAPSPQKPDHVGQVITDKGHYPADLVITAVGFRPNTDLLSEAEKTGNGALIVDGAMKTSIPDVWAVGDSVAMYHAALDRHQQVALATNAVKSGIAAASSINGIPGVTVESMAGTNAICVFENNLASTGLSEAAARELGLPVASSYIEDADRPEFMNDYGITRIKLVYHEKTFRLLGAQIGSHGEINHTEVIYFLALAIQKKMALPEIAFTDVYFLPHFNKPFNFILTAILKAIGLDYEAAAGKSLERRPSLEGK
ncbi:NADPH-dependent 2,4-dienoyl-CoA reductase, sulfur reductase [Alkalispirochaeta americana]|uniref:NADPH-dependent 2,4-dienoyl-CoA reductase, sulfur reductase n=1 Tax=Alkalispirochaeta americana TaxID=159291 RepID=A0A1N6T0A8_9SPIO|nr:FAD-dependent oxidoreductase [Alkalispirochaeta americana]SIQ46536.1 NADPH-dependent 2,4-dienoyl-CoA reductase, sulfur reductase [Alkalispirochaeta americana]